jgi:2,4-dienoyl-CoA reductase-like NADH-dependent reductase (Old Yellow Enzyme family)
MAMWRPAERIRYRVEGGRWPTAEEARAARLFQPIRVGPLNLAGRSWVPAMVPWRAADTGEVTPNVLDWYRRFARGRPAALVVEATGIADVASGPLLRIGHDRFVPGLAEIVRVVREASGGETRLLIQLIDFLAIRRRPDPQRFLKEFLALTPRHAQLLGMEGQPDALLRERLAALGEDELRAVLAPREFEALSMGYRERVTDIALPQVRDLPERLPRDFGAAARRAREAGFDGVELHYAHAYTMASFLSATNDRTDGYGGTVAGRQRLPLEVFAAVRREVGTDYAVGCRFLADECIEGGSGIDDATAHAMAFARAGLDFLSLSRGGKFDDAKQPRVGEAAYPYTGRSGYECMPSYHSDARGPFGRNREAAGRIRAAVHAAGCATPVIAGGGVHNFEMAESWLADGSADIVSIARQALADPDWFIKIRLGLGDRVRLCQYTNYCEALDQRHREVTCELWDRERLDEPGVTRSRDGKRRLLAPACDLPDLQDQ